MGNKVDWIIHYVANGVKCDVCSKEENSFREYACNAHTHGMEKYNHKDFQLVLAVSRHEAMRILNTFGLWVQEGRRFSAGEYVEGIYEDCTVRLDEFEESGRKVLRVIIPDKHNVFPDDNKCEYPYTLQKLPEDKLYKMKIHLYQIIPELDRKHHMFQNWNHVKTELDGKVPAEIYEDVFSGDIDAENIEDIFRIFNVEFPKNYRGRSMSVSDVAEIVHSPNKSEFFYCDSTGFEKISFEKDKTMAQVQNHNFDSDIKIRDNVMAYFISNDGLTSISCEKFVLQRCKYSRSQLGYEIECQDLDDAEPKRFHFLEKPPVVLTKCCEKFPQELLYTDLGSESSVMRYGAHSVKNLGIVCTWLGRHGFEFENL